MTFQLARSNHPSFEQGACVMEAVAYVTGEAWSDHPKCASPVITRGLIRMNDSLPDDLSQQLLPYVIRVAGTADGVEVERKRAWIAADWALRVALPHALRTRKRNADADWLAALEPVDSAERWQAIRPRVQEIRAYAAAAAAAADQARARAWSELLPSFLGAIDRMIALHKTDVEFIADRVAAIGLAEVS